jgi:uncharacterized RDD family membrane protein YckC
MNSITGQAGNELAGRGRRLVAALLDLAIVGLVAFIIMWPLGLFEHEQAYERTQLLIRLFLLLGGSYVLVNGWWLHKRGQTVGKRIMGLQIVNFDNGRLLPFWRLLLRALVPLAMLTQPLLMLLAVIDVLFIFGAQRRCLHDRLVGSKVQRVAPGKA